MLRLFNVKTARAQTGTRPSPQLSANPLTRRRALAPLALAPWALGLGGCSPLSVLNGVAAIGSRRAAQDQPYGPHPRQRFDLYRPDGTAPPGGWPLVVFFYGGTWSDGERADYRFAGEALSGAGIATMVADYRLYPEVRYPAFLSDCGQALAWGLKQAGHWGANPRQVVVMGHSAGAYNAAMLALDPRWLRAAGSRPEALAGWIGLAGPYDFLPIANPQAQKVFNFPDTPGESQPIHHVAAGTPPALLLAAEDDPLVNPERNTLGLARALQHTGVPVEARLYPGLTHATLVGTLAWPLRYKAPVLADVRRFVYAQRAPALG